MVEVEVVRFAEDGARFHLLDFGGSLEGLGANRGALEEDVERFRVGSEEARDFVFDADLRGDGDRERAIDGDGAIDGFERRGRSIYNIVGIPIVDVVNRDARDRVNYGKRDGEIADVAVEDSNSFTPFHKGKLDLRPKKRSHAGLHGSRIAVRWNGVGYPITAPIPRI